MMHTTTRSEELVTLTSIDNVRSDDIENLMQHFFTEVDVNTIASFHQPFNHPLMLSECGLHDTLSMYVSDLSKHTTTDILGDVEICTPFAKRLVTRKFHVVPVALLQAIKDAEADIDQVTLGAAVTFTDTHIKMPRAHLYDSYAFGYMKYVASHIDEDDLKAEYGIEVVVTWFEDHNYVRPVSSLWEGFM